LIGLEHSKCKFVPHRVDQLGYALSTDHRFYYRNEECRLSVCTLTLHGLLHVVRDIRNCGPVWTTWTFFMERFCGILQSGLHSRSQPWANLDNWVLQMTYIGQLGARYDLQAELAIYGQRSGDGPSHHERAYPECMP
jgi:hypothetical protein